MSSIVPKERGVSQVSAYPAWKQLKVDIRAGDITPVMGDPCRRNAEKCASRGINALAGSKMMDPAGLDFFRLLWPQPLDSRP